MLSVIVGVIVEAACTITLFVFDEWISNAQQEKIIALETKLAPRTLTYSDIEEIVSTLKKFSGQEFTIASYGGEPAAIAGRISFTLERAGWKWFDPENKTILLAGSVGIQVWVRSEGTVRDATEALTGALKARFAETEWMPVETAKTDPDNKIEILVGRKY